MDVDYDRNCCPTFWGGGETKVWPALLLLLTILAALVTTYWMTVSKRPCVKEALLFVDRISPKPRNKREF